MAVKNKAWAKNQCLAEWTKNIYRPYNTWCGVCVSSVNKNENKSKSVGHLQTYVALELCEVQLFHSVINFFW